MIEKYVGRTVEIIYLDSKGKITQRKIEVKSIKDHKIKAFCLDQCEPRIFKIANILAISPINNKRFG
jgi:predicted DNA-binding transcriptional regulator YafY